MADWTGFWWMIDRHAAKIRSNGKEVERSLQLASGAVVLTVLSALPSTWVEPLAPLAQLRPIYVNVLTGAGLAFLFALGATFNRAVMFGPLDNDDGTGRRELVVKLCVWAAPIIVSLTLVIVTGIELIEALEKTG